MKDTILVCRCLVAILLFCMTRFCIRRIKVLVFFKGWCRVGTEDTYALPCFVLCAGRKLGWLSGTAAIFVSQQYAGDHSLVLILF
jgi:hypothetical protein